MQSRTKCYQYLRGNRFILRAVFSAVLCLSGFAAVGFGQTPGPGPNDLEFSDGGAGTPCDTDRGLPCDRTPPHLVGLPDPRSWSVARDKGSRTFYRRATSRERKTNGWPVGTYLVAGPGPADVAKGARRASLVIPLSDTSVQQVKFVLDERVEGLEFYERVGLPGSPNLEVESRKLTPVLFEYFNQGFDKRNLGPVKGAWATIVASDDGGIYASGLAGRLEFKIDGPGTSWDLEPIPAPFGLVADQSEIVKVELLGLGTFGTAQAAACQNSFASDGCDWLCVETVEVPCTNNPHLDPAPSSHCLDTVDNDFDETTDVSDQDCIAQANPDENWGDPQHPGFPVRRWESGNSFALFGEGRFCTQFATAEFSAGGIKTSGNWINRLTAMGWKTEALLNQAIGFQAVTGREKQFRYRAGGCWIFPTLAAATDCAQTGSQCLTGYPYSGASNTGSGYYNKVWDDVHHATAFGLVDALHSAQTVFWGGNNAETSFVLDCEDGDACCGAAPIAFTGAQRNPTKWGASVVQYEEPGASCNVGGAGVTGAHEFGHNSGIFNHVDTESFMHSPSWDNPALPPADKATLVACVESADCPRPSGFRYQATP